VCAPHGKQSDDLIESWKNDDNIVDIYFATATFANESTAYFPDKANNYVVASFKDMGKILADINSRGIDRLSFMFSTSDPLFERHGESLNYVSLYFTKYAGRESEISDLARVIARRDRVRRASLAQMQLLVSSQPKFTFPYPRNLVMLEVDGKSTHQTDQKYCELTRRDVARKGIALNNLVSFSILDKLK
jgi:hypothetical protein